MWKDTEELFSDERPPRVFKKVGRSQIMSAYAGQMPEMRRAASSRAARYLQTDAPKKQAEAVLEHQNQPHFCFTYC